MVKGCCAEDISFYNKMSLSFYLYFFKKKKGLKNRNKILINNNLITNFQMKFPFKFKNFQFSFKRKSTKKL